MIEIDVYAADWLRAYSALACGKSSFPIRELTSHAQAAMCRVGCFLFMRFPAEQRRGLFHIKVTR